MQAAAPFYSPLLPKKKKKIHPMLNLLNAASEIRGRNRANPVNYAASIKHN